MLLIPSVPRASLGKGACSFRVCECPGLAPLLLFFPAGAHPVPARTQRNPAYRTRQGHHFQLWLRQGVCAGLGEQGIACWFHGVREAPACPALLCPEQAEATEGPRVSDTRNPLAPGEQL